MQYKELKKMIHDLEKKKSPSAFLRIPRQSQARCAPPKMLETDFGTCPVINADDEHIYFEVTLLQMKALAFGMKYERSAK